MEQRSRVTGDIINFEDLTHAPVNEQEVVFLFAKIHQRLRIRIDKIQQQFPDAIGGERKNGKRGGWEEKKIEFEFASSDFKNHAREKEACDIVVCWKHDWKACPARVIELKSEIEKLRSTGQQAQGTSQTSAISRPQKVGKAFGVGSRGGTTYNKDGYERWIKKVRQGTPEQRRLRRVPPQLKERGGGRA